MVQSGQTWTQCTPPHHEPPQLIEGGLQQHEAQFATAAIEARQMAVNQEQALNAIAEQIQRLTNGHQDEFSDPELEAGKET